MQDWREALLRGLVSGTSAALTSSAMLTLCARLEHRRLAAPHNGPSQWIWGEAQAYNTRASWRHTAVGYAIHHASSVFWATGHEKIFRMREKAVPAVVSIGQGLITSAVAALVDYGLTPRRLQPGFDKHLKTPSIIAVYAAFGIGLTLPRLIRRARR